MWLGLALMVTPCVALIGIEIYQAFWNTPELKRNRESVLHTVEVIRMARGVARAMRDAERGQRGFLITEDSAYLEPYRTGVRETTDILAKLKQLTSDNPEQQRRLPVLEQQISAKLAE